MITKLKECSDFIKYERKFGLRVLLYDLIQINKLYNKKEYINKILDFANENRLRFTFFIRTYDLHKKTGIIKQLKNQGHEIACHGHSHVRYKNKNRQWLRRELKQCLRQFSKFNVKLKGFRSPFLSENDLLYEILDELNFEYVSNRFFRYEEPEKHYNVFSDHISWPSDWHGLVVNKMTINEIIEEWKNNPGTLLLHPWIFSKYIEDIKEIVGNRKDFRIISNLNKKNIKISFDLY